MKRTWRLLCGGDLRTVTLESTGGRWSAMVDDRAHPVSTSSRDGDNGRFLLETDGKRIPVYVVNSGPVTYVSIEGSTYRFEEVTGTRRVVKPEDGPFSGAVLAPMPGRVLDVLVAEGDTVQRGQVLVLLEAMKMELHLNAPADGRVERVCVAPGQIVERNCAMIQLTPIDSVTSESKEGN
jgi:biotin carboxyl carrier protein